MLNAGSLMTGRRRALSVLGALPCSMALASLAVPLSGVASPSTPARGPFRRIVVLDWDLTEMILSLGIVPVGVARPSWYMRLDGVPPLPPQVVDTGLLFQPNFEVLQSLAPDLIVITAWHGMLRPLLERIAPTLTVSVFVRGVDAYASVREQTRRLGVTLGREAEADALLLRADNLVATKAKQLRPLAGARRPVYLVQPIDATHVTVYGPNGLFGGVLRELGIANAWQEGTDIQGAAETDLAALAQQPEAQAVMIGTPPGVAGQLSRSPLWRVLPFVKEARVHQIDRLSATGGLVTAMRFATQISGALGGGVS